LKADPRARGGGGVSDGAPYSSKNDRMQLRPVDQYSALAVFPLSFFDLLCSFPCHRRLNGRVVVAARF
jgi:hypothetical protein